MPLFGLADCNNFYCSCERVFHPDLNGRPVVVLSNNDGCIIARSNESKALGLKMGDAFYQVRDVLESNGVAVFSSNYTLYGDMSKRVMSLLSQYTPQLDIYSIDEAFLDLSGMGGGQQLTTYAKGMVRHITRGTGIPISLGIAPTKTLAKMASKFAKNYRGYGGVCLMDTPEKRIKALSLFPIGDVWGIGRRHAVRLNCCGVKTALHFAEKKEGWVHSLMGVTGVRTWRELRGESCIDISELPHKKSICTSRSFAAQGLGQLADVEAAVANFAARCASKLRNQHTACSMMTVFAYTSRFRTDVPGDVIQANVHFPVATNSTQEIVAAAVGALRQRWKPQGGFLYKKAGVIVWDICREHEVQGYLFDTVNRPKQQRLQKAIDEINHKNGYNKIRLATQGFDTRWHLNNEYLSKQYTTNIDDILVVKCK